MTLATSVPILVFLGLSVLDLAPMYATDRQTSDVRRSSSLYALPMGRGMIILHGYLHDMYHKLHNGQSLQFAHDGHERGTD